jgi:hypothetical protein
MRFEIAMTNFSAWCTVLVYLVFFVFSRALDINVEYRDFMTDDDPWMIRPRVMYYLVRISYGKLFELYFVPHKT